MPSAVASTGSTGSPMVALEAADIQAFVHLPAIGADTAEGARRPRLADGADEVSLLAPLLKEGVVGSGKLKGLRLGGQRNQERPDGYLSSHV